MSEQEPTPTLEDSAGMIKALWNLQKWLEDNVRLLVEPHLCHFKDTLSVLSNLYDVLNIRTQRIEIKQNHTGMRIAELE